MSEAIAFDTHLFVKRLTENGFTEEQAEALANGQVNRLNGNLATKADVKAIQRDVEALRQEGQGRHRSPAARDQGRHRKPRGRPAEMDVRRHDRPGRPDRRSREAAVTPPDVIRCFA